jgi:hypothetical protein
VERSATGEGARGGGEGGSDGISGCIYQVE